MQYTSLAEILGEEGDRKALVLVKQLFCESAKVTGGFGTLDDSRPFTCIPMDVDGW